MHHQQRAQRWANGPADVQHGIVERENFRFVGRREVIGKPGLQHCGEDGVSAVDQSEKQNDHHDVMYQWNSNKAGGKAADCQQHIAFFIELVGQNTKTKAEHHANGQRDRHRITDQIDAQVVLPAEVDRHKWQRGATSNR